MNLQAVTTVPTETVEGYAVALSSEAGIRDLMRIKERGFDSGKVFTLVPESLESISKYVLVSDLAARLIKEYFPGELTLILPKNPSFKHFYYDHFDTIGIRIPDHPLFPELLKENGAIILTSANPKGGTPKSTTGHLPSTIIDLTGPKPRILRQGNLIINL
jgi:L-threonylcarbamoyladenylate synthase